MSNIEGYKPREQLEPLETIRNIFPELQPDHEYYSPKVKKLLDMYVFVKE